MLHTEPSPHRAYKCTCAFRIVLVVSSAGIGNFQASSTDGIFLKREVLQKWSKNLHGKYMTIIGYTGLPLKCF